MFNVGTRLAFALLESPAVDQDVCTGVALFLCDVVTRLEDCGLRFAERRVGGPRHGGCERLVLFIEAARLAAVDSVLRCAVRALWARLAGPGRG